MPDDRQLPPDDGADATPPTDPWATPPRDFGPAADETRPQEPVPGGETRPQEPVPGGETRPQEPVPGDETSVLPPVRDDRWTARAGVPPARKTEAGPEGYPPDAYGEEPNRRWWAPALVGLLALVLIGLFALGVWLILRSGQEEPGPAPTISAGPTRSVTPSAIPSPTAAPSPTASPPTIVAVPALIGLNASDAEEELRRAGLGARIVQRVDGNTRPGTVVDTDPPAGTQVQSGTVVTLVVAVAPPTTAAPTSGPPSSPPGDDD